MLRLSMASLAGALSCIGVPLAAQAQSAGLPDGEGKELVEAVCTACHQTNQITRSSGYTRAGWEELIATMIDLSGSPPEQGAIVDYLAMHFPPNDRAGAQADARRRRDRVQGMAGADARPALARPGRGGRTARSGGPGNGAT